MYVYISNYLRLLYLLIKSYSHTKQPHLAKHKQQQQTWSQSANHFQLGLSSHSSPASRACSSRPRSTTSLIGSPLRSTATVCPKSETSPTSQAYQADCWRCSATMRSSYWQKKKHLRSTCQAPSLWMDQCLFVTTTAAINSASGQVS